MLTPTVELKNKVILVTGANLVMELLRTVEPVAVVSLDNMNNYYDVALKEFRLAESNKLVAEHPTSRWEFIKGDIGDKPLLDSLFVKYGFAAVVNLAVRRASGIPLPIRMPLYRAT